LLNGGIYVYVNVPYTIRTRYRIAPQSIPSHTIAVSRILFRGHSRIFFANFLAFSHSLADSYDRHNCPRLHVRDFRRAYLQHVRCNWVRKWFKIRASMYVKAAKCFLRVIYLKNISEIDELYELLAQISLRAFIP